MPSIEEQIRDIEDEIKKTKYNKATEHHIGKLKAKLSRMREESERRGSGKGGGYGYSVKKSGNATVAMVGFPSVGKSTLLTKLTKAKSEIGAYDFTTLDIIPGLIEYKGTKIQLLDMPGLIKGAGRGKGRGREVIAVARTADLILFVVDVFNVRQLPVLLEELRIAGIRINERPPEVAITKKGKDGIMINSTVRQTHMGQKYIKDVMNEYGYLNADVVLRENITIERLIDALAANRIYTKGVVALNKIDLAEKDVIKKAEEDLKGWTVFSISGNNDINLDTLTDGIHTALDFVRIYLRKRSGEVDRDEPLIVKNGATVETVCTAIHKDIIKNFRYALVWGPSAKFPGQSVGLRHRLKDEDVLTFVLKNV